MALNIPGNNSDSFRPKVESHSKPELAEFAKERAALREELLGTEALRVGANDNERNQSVGVDAELTEALALNNERKQGVLESKNTPEPILTREELASFTADLELEAADRFPDFDRSVADLLA